MGRIVGDDEIFRNIYGYYKQKIIKEFVKSPWNVKWAVVLYTRRETKMRYQQIIFLKYLLDNTQQHNQVKKSVSLFFTLQKYVWRTQKNTVKMQGASHIVRIIKQLVKTGRNCDENTKLISNLCWHNITFALK